jgi:hypothetical protein
MASIGALASNAGRPTPPISGKRWSMFPLSGKPDGFMPISGKPDISFPISAKPDGSMPISAKPDIGGGALNSLATRGAKPDVHAKARSNAVEFESVFLNSMFSQMFTGMDGEGPFGGAGAGAGVWRSFLTDEYAKAFAKAGGIGIADHVYRALIAQQEVPAK